MIVYSTLSSSVQELARKMVKKATESPEFWLFQTGHNEKKLERLEIVKETGNPFFNIWKVFDGGFVSLGGKVDVSDANNFYVAKEKSNCFLSVQESLYLLEHLTKELELCDLEQLDAIAQGRYLPFFRTKGGQIWVIDVQQEDHPVYEVTRWDNPEEWVRVYNSLMSLMHQYIECNGDVRVSPLKT